MTVKGKAAKGRKPAGSVQRNPSRSAPSRIRDARGRFVSTKGDPTVRAVRSAVGFFRQAVKRRDIRGILEDLSKL